MATIIGTFIKQDNGSFTGTLRTLNVTADLTISPVSKETENAPDYRINASKNQGYEVGAAWSKTAKKSGEEYLNLKIAAPEFGQNSLHARLVKRETPDEYGISHLALWKPRDR